MSKLLKSSYSIDHQVESFFTGNRLIFEQSGEHFYCAYGSTVNKVSVDDGQVKAQITTKNEGDAVIGFTITSDDQIMIIAYYSGLITKFDLSEEVIKREFKSIHKGRISYLKTNLSNTLLATGSSDGTVKLWNLQNHYCSHNLKGVNGVITCIEFLTTPKVELLLCSGNDDIIHIFELETSSKLKKLKTHCSTITDLKLTEDGKRLLSVGRDKLAVFWNVDIEDKDNFGSVLRTIPLFESVESAVLINTGILNELLGEEVESDRTFFATIGEDGLIKFWDTKTGSKLFSQNEAPLSDDRSPGTSCHQICFRPGHEQLCTVSSEKNIFLYDLPRLNIVQQLQGHLDEILSACWFAKNKYLAIASNSNDLKVMGVSTSSCQHLKGHSDIILCVKKLPSDSYCLLTSSKDCTVLIWSFERKTMSPNIIFRATGHTHSVYAICALNGGKIFFSGGEDTTLKKWSISGGSKSTETTNQSSPETRPLIALQTIKAHDDRIDDIAISPTDELVATASRDKTAKIFTVDGLQILATLKGHRRGVHAIKFSPEDRVVVTAADVVLRMWNLQDFTCIKTFQGHDCSVLNFEFLSTGLQILSAASDGNMKLWDCKTNECVKTIDAHTGNVWAMSLTGDDEKLVTGGQDERLIIWRDTTEEEREERLTKLQTQVAQEQDFVNYINKKKWRKAFKMAIAMENQAKTLYVIREILLNSHGLEELDAILEKTSLDRINFLIECCVGWMATAKNSSVAQQTLNLIIHRLDNDQLLKMPSFLSSIDQMRTLTEKGFNRYERLVQQASFVNFFVNSFRIQ